MAKSKELSGKEKALLNAKKLEKKKLLTKEQEISVLKNLAKESDDAKKLLKPAWFVKKYENKKNKK